MKEEHASSIEKPSARVPWNKGKLVGAKPPLNPSHVWSIRTKMQIEGKKRDLALLNLAIDSNCVAAMWSLSASMTWRRVDTRWIAQPSDRRRPAGRCDLR